MSSEARAFVTPETVIALLDALDRLGVYATGAEEQLLCAIVERHALGGRAIRLRRLAIEEGALALFHDGGAGADGIRYEVAQLVIKSAGLVEGEPLPVVRARVTGRPHNTCDGVQTRRLELDAEDVPPLEVGDTVLVMITHTPGSAGEAFAGGWRASPPTAAEVRACASWLVRCTDKEPDNVHEVELTVDEASGEVLWRDFAGDLCRVSQAPPCTRWAPRQAAA